VFKKGHDTRGAANRRAASRLRVRSGGFWALAVGALGLLGCLAGAIELWLYGVVTIRVGHEPETGDSAARMLLSAAAVSAVFVGAGLVQIRRSRRHASIE